MHSLIVREAVVEDIEVLEEISSNSLRFAWTQIDFLDAISKRQSKVIVCETNGITAGYVVCYHAADEGEIPSIAVRKEFRRQGIASYMLDKLWDTLKTEGIDKLFLEVREGNIPAQKLYEAMGFLRVGVRKGFYSEPTEDAYIMMKMV